VSQNDRVAISSNITSREIVSLGTVPSAFMGSPHGRKNSWFLKTLSNASFMSLTELPPVTKRLALQGMWLSACQAKASIVLNEEIAGIPSTD
jgi:hypothetical protein